MAAKDVAEHYNNIRQDGIGVRTESRIFYLRNLNNWVKSQLIDEVNKLLKEKNITRPRVMDLCCGKGGDLKKWHIAKTSSMVMADVADVSIQQAKGRYEEFSSRERRDPWFKVQFIVADCTKVDLATVIEDPAPFDIVSCQFALHYSFVNEQSARTFLKNATQSLKPGGYLIGTLPDADRIVWAARQGDGEFSNSVCSVKFTHQDELSGQPSLFGSQFHFNLDSQVNCPEFLAYFPLLQHLLAEMDMELAFVRKFPDAIRHYQDDGRGLMGRMQALEPYPCQPGVQLSGEEKDYAQAAEFLKKLDPAAAPNVGTLSESEWQACCMYLVFAFRKRDPSEVKTEPAAVAVKEEIKSEEAASEKNQEEDDDEPIIKKMKVETQPESEQEESDLVIEE